MSALYPDTTYFYESGGEPDAIPELTYEDFTSFHAQFYHPSNSRIFLYGNVPAEKTLAFLEKEYLGGYEAREVDSAIGMQPRWDSPRELRIEAPAAKEDDGTASVIVCWLLGSATDPVDSLLGTILTRYLLGTQSSPLRRALIDSGLGEDLDDMTGFEPDLVQMFVAAGLRKTRPERAEAIRDLIFETLQKQATGGVDEQTLEGAIRQVEFRLREISDSHFPYNLMLADRCLRSWLYDGDPLSHLKFEYPLSIIKKEKERGTKFFEQKIRELFIENKHHLVSTVVASAKLGEALGRQTEEQTRKLTQHFGSEDKKRFHDETLELLKIQKAQPTAKALATIPKLHKAELPKENQLVETEIDTLAGVTVHRHPVFTSGISYLDIAFDLSVVPAELLPYYPLYSELLTRCGAAGLSYEQMATRIALNTGGIGNSEACTTRAHSVDDLLLVGFFHGKALTARFDEMLGILQDLFLQPDLDDPKLIRDILLEMRNGLSASITRSGHHFAAGHASSRLTYSRYIDEILGGVHQLRFLDRLVKSNDMDRVVDAIKRIHQIVIRRTDATVALTDDAPDRQKGSLERFLGALPERQEQRRLPEFEPGEATGPIGIEISSSVNYVSRCWRVDTPSPSELGQHVLLARNLSTGFLWDKIRVEGGAYGGMAFAGSSSPVFSCASYRDPNLVATLNNFVSGLELVAAGLAQDELDQSIIGTIGRIDSPRSPHAKGYGETMALMGGRTREYRRQLRESVLEATPEELARRAQRLLEEKRNAITVIGSADAFKKAEQQGTRVARQKLLEE
jgi:hypothetical protein